MNSYFEVSRCWSRFDWSARFPRVMPSPRPPSRPTPLPSVQSQRRTTTRASRPWSESSETVGEGHVCTHCRAPPPSSSSKVGTDGPFPEQASSEKLIGEERLGRNRVKLLFLLFLGILSRNAHFQDVCLSNEATEKGDWECYIQTLCLRRFVTVPKLYICGEFPFIF